MVCDIMNHKTIKVKNPIKGNIFLGILIICILSIPQHYLYDFSGKLLPIGLLAPINESVWEHLKLGFYPTILWWIISYLILRKKTKISFARWFFSLVITLVICLLFIPSFYYTYTGAFGFHSMLLNIFSLILAISIAQFTAFCIYRNINLKKYHVHLSAIVFIALLIAFISFTFIPPHLPLFMDPSTGKYGL